jgi:hypothetical protein
MSSIKRHSICTLWITARTRRALINGSKFDTIGWALTLVFASQKDHKKQNTRHRLFKDERTLQMYVCYYYSLPWQLWTLRLMGGARSSRNERAESGSFLSSILRRKDNFASDLECLAPNTSHSSEYTFSLIQSLLLASCSWLWLCAVERRG